MVTKEILVSLKKQEKLTVGTKASILSFYANNLNGRLVFINIPVGLNDS